MLCLPFKVVDEPNGLYFRGEAYPPNALATRLKSVFDFNHFIYFIHVNQSRVTLCAMFLQDTDADGESEDEEGFYLEYVLQSSQQVVPGGQPTSGPHVLEIIGKGARLCWPHLCQTAFVTEIAAAFSHYFVRPWVSPNPEV